jgi:predicted CXXCH cytochrome family protein
MMPGVLKSALLAAALAVTMAVCGAASLACAEELDEFDVGESDPQLPAKIWKWNAECYGCHSGYGFREQGLKEPPHEGARKGMDMAKLAGMLVAHEGFERGVHGAMACKDCHTDNYVVYPHIPDSRGKIKGCESCHQAPAKIITPEFNASIHYKEHTAGFTCLACHDSHLMQKASKLKSPRLIAQQDNAMCIGCHDSDVRYARFKPAARRPDLKEAHAFLPNPDMHWRQVRCIDCHTPESDQGVSHQVTGKGTAERDCASCHSAASALNNRLYRRSPEDQPFEMAGFLNAFVLNEAYVVGATRSLWLDKASLLAGAVLLAGLGIHAAIRLRRRRK